MASLRDIRRKIRVVKNISQITQAMKMVAAAKLRRVQERVQRGKPYSETMAELVGMLSPHVREFSHPLLDNRPVRTVGVVVIAADKGLCGSYNSNLLRIAHTFIDTKGRELGAADGRGLRVLTVGRKATDYFTRRGYDVQASYGSIGVETPYENVRAAANAITGMFLTESVDQVYICYTEFINPITQRPQVIKFLPIEPPGGSTSGGAGDENNGEVPLRQDTQGREVIFEPAAPELLARLLPRFVETRVYQLLLEATASEFGARMTAMTNATKNAKDQIESLTLVANRQRQAGITKELLDIVGGAEALNG